MNEQRLIDIETKLAHQELLITDLNQVMARQQETITQMQAALKSFLKNYRDGNGEPQIAPVNEKPPHY